MDNEITPAELKEASAYRLRLARIAYGDTSIKNFAAMLKIADNRLSMYELGARSIPYDILYKVIKITGVTADWLLFGDDRHLPMEMYRRIMRIEEGRGDE